MSRRSWLLLLAWCLVLGVGFVAVQSRLSISADLRLFMPTPHTEAQRLLVGSIGESPASRLELLAIKGSDPHELARISKALVAALGTAREFEWAANGEQAGLAIAERLLPYRYLITDSFDQQPLDEAELASALTERAQDMSSPLAGMLEEWLPRDPTLETLHLMSQWQPRKEPRRIDDVWFSADGAEALLVVETRAAAFDPDGQTRALERLQSEFARARGAASAQLTVSGSGYFSSLIKNRTQREATLFGSAATVALLLLMWLAYRQIRFALLGALPLLSAALAGLAAVGVMFESVHGITLAFGFTLIGVAQDYPMHLFSHLRVHQHPAETARGVWPPLRTGVASTCIAYLAFLVSGVTGLAQLACLTVTGLAVAALTTRYLLPEVIGSVTRDSAQSAWLDRLNVRIDRLPRPFALLAIIPAACAAVLFMSSQPFWQNDLSRLTPVPLELLRKDAVLRHELATPDLRYLLVVTGRDEQDVLEHLETLDAKLAGAVQRGAIGSYDHPARYLPSNARQLRRRAALPDAGNLRGMLTAASVGQPFDAALFAPFAADVARARELPPLALADLAATPLALRVSSALFARDGRWHGIVSFYDVHDAAALEQGLRAIPGATFLDLKAASEELIAAQRAHILRCLEFAALLLVAVIWLALRRVSRVARVLMPMALTTLVIVAVLRASGISLNLFHLISLVLAAGLGLDYALFFEHAAADADEQRRTLHALLVCSLSTLLVFALLAFSTAPVLQAIGVTVSLGVMGNFLFALLLARERRARLP
ncbi:MAG TPA: MMPL family transporter [Steroidobacteraceae bacterium]|jgi:predicted exporter|nr:MMPL family transporter [Steroidobacteraceae bacterium]